IGAIGVNRRDPGDFTPAEIAVLQTFADQAVIAIENVRLFNETKEALERETAMGDILRVISRSPTDLQPVLDAVAQSAAAHVRVCGRRYSARGRDPAPPRRPLRADPRWARVQVRPTARPRRGRRAIDAGGTACPSRRRASRGGRVS